MDLKRHIRDVPDFPEPGVRFRDTAPLLQDGKAFQHAVDGLIASGGTAVAAAKLVELATLGRREWPWDCDVFSLIRYE
jgi:adenine/guanine phosphoribosyltransferase-like PRPP-binding protein